MKTDIRLIWEAYIGDDKSSLRDMLNKVKEANSLKDAQRLFDEFEDKLEVGSELVDKYIQLKYELLLVPKNLEMVDKKLLLKSPKYSYFYAYNRIYDITDDNSFKLGEPIIAKSAEYSFRYASDVLNGRRFKLGEPAIAEDAEYSYKYSKYILKFKRFELGEPAIVKNVEYTIRYMKCLSIKDKEDFIKKYNIIYI